MRYLPASAISSSEVATLNHELFDYTMEFATFVSAEKCNSIRI